MHGEVTGLNVKVSAAREAEHVLALRVPGRAVGIGLLEGGREVSLETTRQGPWGVVCGGAWH